MKTLIVILMLAISQIMTAQAERISDRPNSLMVAFQPVDLGLGFRYDRQFNYLFGSYVSVTYGKFRLPDGGYFKDHVRIVIGGLKYFYNQDHIRFSWGGGIVYSHIGEYLVTIPDFPTSKVLCPFSFELTFGTVLDSRFAVSMSYDFAKAESSVNFGISF